MSVWCSRAMGGCAFPFMPVLRALTSSGDGRSPGKPFSPQYHYKYFISNFLHHSSSPGNSGRVSDIATYIKKKKGFFIYSFEEYIIIYFLYLIDMYLLYIFMGYRVTFQYV